MKYVVLIDKFWVQMCIFSVFSTEVFANLSLDEDHDCGLDQEIIFFIAELFKAWLKDLVLKMLNTLLCHLAISDQRLVDWKMISNETKLKIKFTMYQ